MPKRKPKKSNFGFFFHANTITNGPDSGLANVSAVPTSINANTTDPQINQQPPSSNHPGGCQVAMMDGSARFVNENVQIEILMAAAGMKDGQDDDLE